ncbi:MAG: hypothetical protein GKR93_01725 [Gammaproteobacteria bacterium]|nr:hypothetical protein [Gammaproteobacteria bacterium]
MAVSLPLDKMSREEKIQAMEVLWEDLCNSNDGVHSPEWHKKLLKDREEALEQDDDEFTDWDEAKKEIASRIS